VPIEVGARTGTRRWAALAALAVLAATYAALAIPVAAPGSTVVLAAVERSPDWLLGPWRALGAGGADGELTGPLFYVGLWVAMLAYVAVLALASSIGTRLALGSVVAFHVLFLLAPPLLSQDVFSYISYARLEVVHGLDPYTHSPSDVPLDAAYPYAGSKDATSVYGPLFTLLTLPLAKLSVPAAFWTLKCIAALASLAVVLLTRRCARVLGRDPQLATLAVGLNPLVLVHVVGGAHNDALVMALVMGAITVMLVSAREWISGALGAAAAAVKLSAGLALPFLVLGGRRRVAVLAGTAVTGIAVLAAGLAAFGLETFDAIGLIGENQERTSRWSIPQRTADAIALVFGGDASRIVDFTRGAFALAFLGLLVLLLRRCLHSRGSWVEGFGWATLGLLVASAWLVPWYAIWLVPLAAIAGSPGLWAATLALCAYMLVIAVPL
jgi:hypothetical protein